MRTTRRLRTVAVVGALMMAVTTPAWAANERAQGQAKGGPAHGPTEDNDGDGVANTPDPVGDADNRHPSGRDRHAEGGQSGNQGKSPSDPDGDANGGADKPGGEGGLDAYDQDGNNGCGNDDDFEDDNRGRCLGRQRAAATSDGEATNGERTKTAGSSDVNRSGRSGPSITETSSPSAAGQSQSSTLARVTQSVNAAGSLGTGMTPASPLGTANALDERARGESPTAVLGRLLVASAPDLPLPFAGRDTESARAGGERARGVGALPLTGLGLSGLMIAGGAALAAARIARRRLEAG